MHCVFGKSSVRLGDSHGSIWFKWYIIYIYMYVYYVYDTCGSIWFYMILVHGISTRSWNRAPAKSLRLPADKGVPSSDGFPLSNQSSLQDKTCTDLHHLHHSEHIDGIDGCLFSSRCSSDCFLFCTAMQCQTLFVWRRVQVAAHFGLNAIGAGGR